MRLRTLHDLLAEQLRDLHNAAVHYRDLLPIMKINATDHDLFAVLGDIADNIDADLVRIEDVCGQLQIEPTGLICEAMRGLMRESKIILSDTINCLLIDAALISCAQRVAHYQIAGYGTARQFARVLGKLSQADIMDDLTQRASLHDRELSRMANGDWHSRGVKTRAQID